MSWKIDTVHTRVVFSVPHMMITRVHGRFEELEGSVDFDEADPVNSSVDVRIKAESITTGESKRDGHLKSPDFLDVENHPHLHFESTRIEVLDDSHGRITGDLTIRGITREVTLDVEYAGQVKSPFGFNSAGFTAKTQVDRSEWGLNWNQTLETGGVLVGNKIDVSIEVELIEQSEGELEAVGD